jgi:hypothetical protein
VQGLSEQRTTCGDTQVEEGVLRGIRDGHGRVPELQSRTVICVEQGSEVGMASGEFRREREGEDESLFGGVFVEDTEGTENVVEEEDAKVGIVCRRH